MQSTISQTGAASFAGLLDGIAPHDVRSYAAEAAIGMGVPVMLGTDPAKQVLKATSAAAIIGITLHDQARVQDANGLVQYAAKETVSVLTKGRVWVSTTDAVVAGAVANITVATMAFTDASVTSGIEALTQISARFITATTGAGLALIEIK